MQDKLVSQTARVLLVKESSSFLRIFRSRCLFHNRKEKQTLLKTQSRDTWPESRVKFRAESLPLLHTASWKEYNLVKGCFCNWDCDIITVSYWK